MSARVRLTPSTLTDRDNLVTTVRYIQQSSFEVPTVTNVGMYQVVLSLTLRSKNAALDAQIASVASRQIAAWTDREGKKITPLQRGSLACRSNLQITYASSLLADLHKAR